MDKSLNNKPELKKRFSNIFIENRGKIFSTIILAIVIFIAIFIWNEMQKKKDVMISEKYVKAGIFLMNGDNENAKNYYEEIIMSKNKFYSLLSLNTILEKNLITDNKKILKYFEHLEKKNFEEEKLDLITFKKALFFIKISEKQKSRILLNKLIEKNSDLKFLAKEIVIE